MHPLTVAAVSDDDEEAKGAGLVATMQACPVKEMDLEPERFPMPVPDASF
jgi:hypothetical protein